MEVEASSILSEKKPLLKKLLEKLLDKYEYASILATDASQKRYSVSKQGINIAEGALFSELGFVVKVYDGDSYCEYAGNHVAEENIDSIVDTIGTRLVPWKGSLPEEVTTRRYHKREEEKTVFNKSTEYKIHPEKMGDEEIIRKVGEIRQKALEKNDKLVDFQVRVDYQIYHKIFLSPSKDLTQNIMWSSGVLVALATAGQELKNSFKGVSVCGGMEVFDCMEDKIDEALTDLEHLLISEPITPGEYDCICAPDVTGMIVHEAFGHGVEMDMFVKERALAKKYIGKYVASPLVTMHDGASAASQTATFFFDDEGTLAQDTVIIEKGILKKGLCDVQSAMSLHTEPTGNGRRQSTSHKAYTRMTNTFFEAGTDKYEDMVASIQYGFLLEAASSGMEDPKNWGIQCMVSIAREIKDGKFTGKVFSPIVLTGYVPDLLKSISMMSDTAELSGVGMCGKGYKEWVKVSDGGPYIKARIRLG